MLNLLRLRWLPLLTLLGLLSACGKRSNTVAEPETPNREAELKDFVDVLRLCANEGKSPPGDLKSLLETASNALPGVAAIQRGDIVVNWKCGIISGSTAVLAYEKDAPQNGGFVLLQNGDVKKLSAKEYQEAPPPR